MSSEKERHSRGCHHTKYLGSRNGKHFISNCTPPPKTFSAEVTCFASKGWLISDSHIYRVKSTSDFTIRNFDECVFTTTTVCIFLWKQLIKLEQASISTLKGRIPLPTIYVVNPLGQQCSSNCRQRNSFTCPYNKQIVEKNNSIENIFDIIK